MTPLMITIAIHYHCRADDYGVCNGDNNFHAPAVQDALRHFVEAGLLAKQEPTVQSPVQYIATDGLKVYVERLLEVPWPVRGWIMPQTSPRWPAREFNEFTERVRSSAAAGMVDRNVVSG